MSVERDGPVKEFAGGAISQDLRKARLAAWASNSVGAAAIVVHVLSHLRGEQALVGMAVMLWVTALLAKGIEASLVRGALKKTTNTNASLLALVRKLAPSAARQGAGAAAAR